MLTSAEGVSGSRGRCQPRCVCNNSWKERINWCKEGLTSRDYKLRAGEMSFSEFYGYGWNLISENLCSFPLLSVIVYLHEDHKKDEFLTAAEAVKLKCCRILEKHHSSMSDLLRNNKWRMWETEFSVICFDPARMKSSEIPPSCLMDSSDTWFKHSWSPDDSL